MVYQIWDDIPVLLGHISLFYMGIATATCLVSWAMRGMRYKFILSTLDIQVSHTFATAMIFVSQFVNMVVPARLGDVTRAFILNEKQQVLFSRGLSSVVIEHVFDFMTIAIIGLVSLYFISGLPSWIQISVISALVLGLVFLIGVFMLRGVSSENRILSFLIRIVDDVRLSVQTTSYAVIFCFTSVATWIFDVFICCALLVMFGQSLTLSLFCVVSLAIVIGNLIKAFPFTPGGIGTYEAALAFIFSFAGVPVGIATAIAIGDHLLKNIVTAVGGGISMILIGGNLFSNIKSALRTSGIL
jgi:uncharacterized membrane protein YbhN (UPF0104 family)